MKMASSIRKILSCQAWRFVSKPPAPAAATTQGHSPPFLHGQLPCIQGQPPFPNISKIPPNPLSTTANPTKTRATVCAVFISSKVKEEMARRRTSRKTHKKSRRSRKQRGGQAPVNNSSMNSSSAESLAQGKEYASLHANQHGGAAVSLTAAAPVGYTGVLDDSLRAIARIGPIDQAIGQIQGMSDQSGGGRRRRGRGTYKVDNAIRNFRYGFTNPVKVTRKSTNQMFKKLKNSLKKLQKSMKKMYKMRGGAGMQVGPVADYSAPGMLLNPAQEARALMGMNPEWKLAADPTSFAPK